MKRILFFCPSIESGGVEKNLFLVSNYFVKKNNNIYVITANKDKKKFFNKKIKYICPKSHRWNNSSRLVKLFICFFLFLKTEKKFIIFSFQSNLAAILLAKIFNNKVVIRSNTAPEKYINNIFKKKLFQFFFMKADKIIVNSKFFQTSLNKILNVKSNVIYNSCGKINFNKKKESFFSTYKGLKIINVGRLTDQKNQLFLLEVFKNLIKNVDSRLLLVGQGQKYGELKKFINENNLNKSVKLYGYSKNPLNLMHQADLFVLTSKYEGLPNVLIEAQMLGLPIISSDCPTGPREILLNGLLGDLFPVNNKKALLNKIKSFYLNNKKLKIKSLQAMKYLSRFNGKNNLDKYYSIIKQFN